MFKRNGSNSKDSSRISGIKALKENFKAKIDKAFYLNHDNVFSSPKAGYGGLTHSNIGYHSTGVKKEKKNGLEENIRN